MSSFDEIEKKRGPTAKELSATVLVAKKQKSATLHDIATLAGLCGDDYAVILDLALSCVREEESPPRLFRAAFLISFAEVNFICRNMRKILSELIAKKVDAERIYRFIEDISQWLCNEARLVGKEVVFVCFCEYQFQNRMFATLRAQVLCDIATFKDYLSERQMERFTHYFQ